MSEDILHQRFGKRFGLLDTDGDGYIDSGDFEAIARKINENFPEVSPRHAAATVSLLQEMWDRMASSIGAGSDRRVSRDEYISYRIGHAQSQEPEDVSAMRRQRDSRTRRRLFEVVDANEDGKVSSDDYRRFYQALGVTGTDADNAFAKLDSDSDGFLSADDIMEVSLEYPLVG